MAKNEIVNVLTIKTEDSQQTIKGLKKEIADLKKTLDNAVIGTDEFEKASKELAMAQAELKTVMADGKKTTDNMEGSYNHLVATMAELKKQWKATADEVKRNELGQQIDAINNQLKELDGTIGNNQRLVGSYAEEFKKALGEQDDATISTRTKLESVQKVTAGLASGYAAVQGAMTLLNIENENLQKAMVKVQSAMAIAQGVGGLKDLVEGLSRGKVAFAGALNGCKAFIGGLSGIQKAIIGTGIGAFVVLLGVLVANWDKVIKVFKGGVDDVEDVTTAIDRLNNKLTENKEKTDQLKAETLVKYAKNIAAASGDIKTIREELEKLNEEEKKNILLGFEMNIQSANDEIKKTKKDIEDAEKRLEILNKRFEQSAKKDQWSSSEYAGVNTGQIGLQIGNVQENIKKLNETLTAQREVLKKAQTELDVYLANQTIDAAEEAVKTEDDKQKKIVNAATAAAEKQKEIDEVLRLSKLTEEEKLIDALDKKYIEYMKVYEGNQAKQLEIFEWYTDEYMKLVEKQLDTEIKAQKQIAEENKKRYEEAVAASENILGIKLGKIDKEEEGKLYLNERQKPKGNGEINAIDNELAKLEGLKTITEEMNKLRIAAIEEEMKQFDESSARYIELQQQKIDITEQTERTISEIKRQADEQEKARQRAVAKSITNTFTSALSSASDIIGALQEGIDTTNKEGFEKNKKMQIANATIGMLVGITNAMAGAYTSKTGPWDWILAGIQAATIATVGGIQIANISKQKFDGSGSGSASVSPSMSMGGGDIPVSYTRNLMGDYETENMNQETRVYILESDIQESNKRVTVRENESSF